MSLAIFDLDNTLIAGDSDYLWGQFLVDQGIVDRDAYENANARFYEEYKSGCLDIVEFLTFALSPLAAHPPERLYRWRETFIDVGIRPILLPAAQALIDKHRAIGDLPLIITATNGFVTTPIAALYGIEHLIATMPEFADGRYTGRRPFRNLPTAAIPAASSGRRAFGRARSRAWRSGSRSIISISPEAGSTAIPTTTCPCCHGWLTPSP